MKQTSEHFFNEMLKDNISSQSQKSIEEILDERISKALEKFSSNLNETKVVETTNKEIEERKEENYDRNEEGSNEEDGAGTIEEVSD